MLKTIISTGFTNNNQFTDLHEHIGNIGLIPLRRINQSKKVTLLENNQFTQKRTNRYQQITALVLSIILIPITLPMTTIGLVSTLYSKSYKDKINELERRHSSLPIANQEPPPTNPHRQRLSTLMANAEEVLFEEDEGIHNHIFQFPNYAQAEELSRLLADIGIMGYSNGTPQPKYVGHHISGDLNWGVVLTPANMQLLEQENIYPTPSLYDTDALTPVPEAIPHPTEAVAALTPVPEATISRSLPNFQWPTSPETFETTSRAFSEKLITENKKLLVVEMLTSEGNHYILCERNPETGKFSIPIVPVDETYETSLRTIIHRALGEHATPGDIEEYMDSFQSNPLFDNSDYGSFYEDGSPREVPCLSLNLATPKLDNLLKRHYASKNNNPEECDLYLVRSSAMSELDFLRHGISEESPYVRIDDGTGKVKTSLENRETEISLDGSVSITNHYLSGLYGYMARMGDVDIGERLRNLARQYFDQGGTTTRFGNVFSEMLADHTPVDGQQLPRAPQRIVDAVINFTRNIQLSVNPKRPYDPSQENGGFLQEELGLAGAIMQVVGADTRETYTQALAVYFNPQRAEAMINAIASGNFIPT